MTIQELDEILVSVNQKFNHNGIKAGMINGGDIGIIWITLNRPADMITQGYEFKIESPEMTKEELVEEILKGIRRLFEVCIKGYEKIQIVGEYEK